MRHPMIGFLVEKRVSLYFLRELFEKGLGFKSKQIDPGPSKRLKNESYIWRPTEILILHLKTERYAEVTGGHFFFTRA